MTPRKTLSSVDPRRRRYAGGWSHGVVILSTSVVVLACSDSDGAPASTFTVRDSVGIQIAETTAPAWGTDSDWTLSDSPVVEIGGASGDETSMLFNVGDVIRLPDDRIGVVNTGTAQIRVYSISGQHLLDVGRSGTGPGEFRRVRRLWVTPQDSIIAYDGSISRITVYDSDLELARTMQLRPQGGASQAFALRPFDSAHLLVDEIILPPGRPRMGLFPGGRRVFARYSRDGTRLNSIGELTAPDNWGFTVQGSMAYTQAPFSVTFPPSWGDGVSLYLGDGIRPRVERRAPDGQLLQEIRWSRALRPVDSEVIDQFRSWRLNRGNDPESRQLAAGMLEGLQFPEVIPTYQSLRVDSEGYLWVERYRARWEEARRWWVFDPSGQ